MEADAEIKKYLDTDVGKIYKHKGCERCKNTGYLGRVAACEIVLVDDKVKQMLSDNETMSEVKEYLSNKGMQTMRESAVDFVKQGLVDVDELKRVFGV